MVLRHTFAVVALGMIGMGYGIAKRNKTNKEGDAR